MPERANITPKVLKWARESARMSPEVAAAKVSTKKERLIEWEDGASQPTIRQAQALARAYRRPFSMLFLQEIPDDFPPLQDFRREGSMELGTASTFIIREIQQKQAWISELFEESSEAMLEFAGKYSSDDDPVSVARDILSTLQIDPSDYSNNNPMKEWIEKAEAHRIFISRTSFIHARLIIETDEIQGFCIADKYAPFVFVNSHDWNTSQLFTLVHELAHIWIGASGVSNEISYEMATMDNLHAVERFCNEAAVNALLPEDIISDFSQKIFENNKSLNRAARKMGVSAFALLDRSFNLGLFTQEKYQELMDEAEQDFIEFLKREEKKKSRQKESKGGPNYYQLLVNKNSPQFTRVVMDAFHGGTIAPNQASNLLNIQINNFSRLESFLNK